jgi:hypothetical protein
MVFSDLVPALEVKRKGRGRGHTVTTTVTVEKTVTRPKR